MRKSSRKQSKNKFKIWQTGKIRKTDASDPADSLKLTGVEQSIWQIFFNRWGIWFVIVIFSTLYSLISVIKHFHFQTGLDLAIYVQSMWSNINFKLPYVTLYPTYGDLAWADHFTPALVLLSPFYFLFPTAVTLLILQVVLISLGTYPIFAYAQKKLKSVFFAYAVSFSYLLFFGTQFALTSDFHSATISAAVLPWVIWLALEGKWLSFLIVSLIFLGSREDTPPLLIVWGIYLLLTRKNVWVGLIVTFVSIIYFVAVAKYLMPWLSVASAKIYSTPGLSESLLDYFGLFINSPIKINTLFLSFAFFAFLPLFSGIFLLLPLSHFFINFLGDTQFAGRWGIFLYYRVQLASLLSFAAILGANNLAEIFKTPQRKRVIVYLFSLVLFFSAVFFDYYFHLPLNTLFKKNFYQDENWMYQAREAIEKVPPQAYLLTQNNFLPHLANRKNIYQFPKNLLLADYVLLDLRSNQPPINFWLSGEYESLIKNVDEMVNGGTLKAIYKKGEVVLFEVVKK